MDRGNSEDSMWDEQDGFFYDLLKLPDGTATRLKVRSLVGLLPMCAATVFEEDGLLKFPEARARILRFIERHPELSELISPPTKPGYNNRRLLAIVDENKLRRMLSVLLDESEFFGPYGIRSLSKVHAEHPYRFECEGRTHQVSYEPAESFSGMFGGNSNWRGPVWMPMNIIVMRALRQYYSYYGDDFKVECPTGSGCMMTLYQVIEELNRRLCGIFLADESGRRPVYGGSEKFQTDPHWKDHVLFYEFFHGDNGSGVGASHQTGWTGLVARLIELSNIMSPSNLLESTSRPLVQPKG